MSFSELNDWDPMEEDFRKSEKLFRMNSISDDLDKCCLYIKNIPVSVSQDVLHNLMADEGRTITRIMINRKLPPGSEVTFGFVHFATSKDAHTAMKAMNGSPPLHLNISFARKKKDNENKESYKIERTPLLNTPIPPDSACHNTPKHDGNGIGRGISAMNGYRNNAMNEISVLAGSRGRGIRIDLDGHKAISQKIKVTTGGSGRTVMMASPEKTPQSEVSELKNTFHQNTPESCKPSQQPVTLQKINTTRFGTGAPELIPNPFFYCFKCAKEAHHSCGICKKPYCSKSCQVTDWPGHQHVCKLAKGISESVLVSFENSQVRANDSSYMSEASSSDCEKSLDPECVPVKSVKRLSNENHHSHQSLDSSSTMLTECTLNKRKLPNTRRMPKSTAEDGCKVIEKVSLFAGQVEKVSVINIESPSKFWVRLKKLANDLLSLEEKLQLIQRVNISHIYPNLFCCTVNGDIICRGKIQEETSNEAQVYLLDHGKTLTVPKSNIFCLPEEFSKYPIQAVCCKLGDNAVKGGIRWSNDESLSFKIHTDNKIYKAIVLNSSDKINDVSLINEDGISLYSILAEEKNAMSCIEELSQASEGDNAPPSVWSKLKPGLRVTLVPVPNEDTSWFYFSSNGGVDLAEILETEKLLVNYSGEDITVCAEEGDFAAGFSSEYQQFYRCLILNRKRGSFLVRYIDYGNEEEITRLNALSPELFQKCSYTVQCKRPASLSPDNFKELVGKSEAVVVKADKNVVELSFSSYKQDNMLCYPCYSSSQSENINIKSPVPSSNNDLSCVPKQVTSPNHVDPNLVARKVLQSKALSLNIKYNVKIVFIKDVSDVCVQLSEDEGKMNAMLTEFNKYCNSKSTSYMPVVGEIVCCKFSDGAWYRGHVKKIVKDKCKIFFVDYGNEDIVSCKDIQHLPEKFSCPKFGISVSLSGIGNENITKKLLKKLLEEFWDMKVIDNTKSPIEIMLFLQNTSLDSLIEKRKDLRSKDALKFRKLPTGAPVDVKISHEDKKYLYFHQVKEMKSLEEYCTKLNSLSTAPIPQKPVINNVYCGLFSDGLWYRVALEEISSNSYTVNFLDYGNSDNVSLDGLREISNDLFAQPVYCIPVVAQNRNDVSLNLEDQYSVEVVQVKNEVQEVKFLNVPEPVKLPNVSSLKKQQLGDGVNEVFICYETGDVRFCQLSADNDSVLNMFKPLQKCSKEGKSPTSVSTGDVISAKSSDGLWYRASVVSDKKAPMYNVRFFDYGNTESVTIDCIRFLPEELLKPPIFAIPIKIQNTEELKDPDVFTNLVSVKKIKIENGVHIVEILLEKDSGLPKMSLFDKTLLSTDSASTVTLCHVDGDLFYVQPASIKDKLTKLTSLLEAENFKDLPQLPEVDDVICAKFSTDGVWYRSSVIEICADKKSVKVSFFDYGNSETISLENIKILPSELCSFPILCLPVKFKDFSVVEKSLRESITTFNVEVLSMDGNIPVVDIVTQNNVNRKSPVKSIVPAYNPVYISSFKISALPPKEPFKVEFKKCVDKFYFAVKCSDYSEMNALSSFLQTNATKPIGHMLFIDEVLLVRRDNLWYRGCIKEVESDKNTCKVYFIDLGITEDIPKSDLCLLPEECKSFPIFVIKVLVKTEEPIILEKQYLGQVSNPNSDGTLTVKVYHQHLFSSIDRKELPVNEKQSVIFCHKEKDLLFLQNLSDIEVLSEVVAALGNCSSLPSIPYKPTVGELVCAMSQCDKAWYRGCVEEVLSSNDYKILFIDYGNSEVVNEQHLRCIPSVLTKFPSLCIPIKFAEKHIAESIDFIKIYSVVAHSKPSDNVQIISLTKPEENDIKDVTNERNIASENASNTISTSKTFKYSSCKYVPLNPGKQDIAIYSVDEGFFIFAAPFNQENISANIQLPVELTEYCTSNGRPFVDGCEPVLDDMVLAQYPEDNQWYRAVVIDKSPPLYDVNFVDYGNSEQLDISCLKKMEEQFMTLDIQAHLCSLTGFTVSSENLEKVSEELKKFTIFSCPEPLEAHVEINDGDIAISVPKITSFLVEKKLAVASNQI